jgi:hypothetical protein
MVAKRSHTVAPAKAGAQCRFQDFLKTLDSRFRGNDDRAGMTTERLNDGADLTTEPA